jgi:hypothetical protein
MAAAVLAFAIVCILAVAVFAAMRGREDPRKTREGKNSIVDDGSINVMLMTTAPSIDHGAVSTPSCDVSTSVDCGSGHSH